MGRSDSGKSLIWALCLLVLDMAVIVHRLALRGGSPMVPQLVADGWAACQVGPGMIMIPTERLDDSGGPGPVAGQPEPSAPSAPGDSGGDVQHAEPQQFRFCGGQVTTQGQ